MFSIDSAFCFIASFFIWESASFFDDFKTKSENGVIILGSSPRIGDKMSNF